MASVWKTAGMGAAAGLAVPVAGLSGLAAAGFMLILVLAMVGVGPARLSQTSLWGLLTSELMLYLLISLAIFTLSFRFLARLQARCQALVRPAGPVIRCWTSLGLPRAGLSGV